MKELNQAFWNQRYLENDTPWDLGQVSTPLKDFIKSLTHKDLTILIPGAGYAHEALYLHQKGFKNVFVCDWAAKALEVFANQVPDFPKEHLLCSDFFELDIQVDLIIEQTFFCALPRNLRSNYAQKTAQLLQNGTLGKGKLTGLLFAQEFEKEGPPFGGTPQEYRNLFSPHFEVEKMELSHNSIQPRTGRELFVIFAKK